VSEQRPIAARRARKQTMLEEARVAARLDPILWMPHVVAAKPKRTEIDPLYKAYRADNRPYRRAFGRGERSRKILLACAQAKLKEMER
jgi:hypothetical protein